MNKDEMIKIQQVLGKASCQGSECENCFLDKEPNCVCAKALYNAGYRKVADDEFVLKQDEVWEFRKDQAEVKFLKNKIKQETARDILQELKDKQIYILENNLFGCNTALIQGINELAIKYGIELG